MAKRQNLALTEDFHLSEILRLGHRMTVWEELLAPGGVRRGKKAADHQCGGPRELLALPSAHHIFSLREVARPARRGMRHDILYSIIRSPTGNQLLGCACLLFLLLSSREATLTVVLFSIEPATLAFTFFPGKAGFSLMASVALRLPSLLNCTT